VRVKLLTALAMIVSGVALGCSHPQPGEMLVTGRAISPKRVASQNVGSMPINIALTGDGKFAITTDAGYQESLWSIRTSDGVGVSSVDFPNPTRRGAGTENGESSEDSDQAKPPGQTNGLYYGLAIWHDKIVYAAQGANDSIAVLSLSPDGKLALQHTFPTHANDFPAGLAVDDTGRLYVANNAAIYRGDPLKFPGSVAVYDPTSGHELGRFTFSDSYGGTSNFPLAIAVLKDGSNTYVASERDDCVYVLNTRDPANITLAAKISTGEHPDAVILSADQSRLYVANSLSDTISVIDTGTDHVDATILLRPPMASDLPGVTPTSLALSPDQNTLYAALGDMNAVAVIDLGSMSLSGYIPSGWYPSAVAVTPDGNRLLVVNAKGTKARNPNPTMEPEDPRHKNGYILKILEGNVTSIAIPTGSALHDATQQVIANNNLEALDQPTENPLASIGLEAGKIKHVIYVIKENRTYDQVLGDMPQGDGDKSLVLFGRDVTPNQHALADRFVLLDNLYACGEVSGDGWVWSTQGMADAYVIRNIPYNYSKRGRKIDTEGQNNGFITGGFPALDDKGKPMATDPKYKNGAAAIPDVGNTGKNIWDLARAAGLSLRNYGFFLSISSKTAAGTMEPDNYPDSPGLQPGGHDLTGITDLDYRRFDLDYPDSDAPNRYFEETQDKNCLYLKTAYGRYDMPCRFEEWNREFQMMLSNAPDGSAVPTLMLVRLPTDHTMAARGGKHSPQSYAADNDFAVGELVQAVSHSPIWKSTAIFVIEDDAQNGPDHVDCHRTTGYVISPWIKAHSVDHHFLNTDSYLRTMELILGLPPMSQYDAVAGPILDFCDAPNNSEPFDAILPSKALIAQINPRTRELRAGDPRLQMAQASDQMDFDHADAAPAQEANQITWQTVHGPGSVMPKPKGLAAGEKDDDDGQ
jgi:YVTN family beta-propeller protein